MHKIILIIVALMVFAALVAGCGDGGRAEQNDTENNVREMDDSERRPTEAKALEQMEIAFEGGYTAEQIKPLLDEALGLYGLPNSEENYSRAGSTLVALRKQNGTREMDILDYMIRSHVPDVEMEFPDAAGLASSFLAAGDE